jgi:hypothetical protein
MSGLSRTQWDFDIRVRQRNLKRGLLKAEEVQARLDALPDVSDLGEVMVLDQPALTGEKTSADEADDDDDDSGDEG